MSDPTRPWRSETEPRRLHWSAEDPVLAQHRLGGRPVVPGTALLLAIADALGGGPLHLADIVFLAPLFGAEDGTSAELVLADGVVAVTGGGRPVLRGRLAAAEAGAGADARSDEVDFGATGPGRFAPESFYRSLDRAGTAYGPIFRRIADAVFDGRTLRVTLTPGAPGAAMLDAAWQAAALLGPERRAHAPFALARIWIGDGLETAAAARLQRRDGTGSDGAGSLTLDGAVTDLAGAVVARFAGLVLRPATGLAPPASPAPVPPPEARPSALTLLAPCWREEAVPTAAAPGSVAAVFAPAEAGFLPALRDAAGTLRAVPLDTAPGGGARMSQALGDADTVVVLAGIADEETVRDDAARLRDGEATGVVPLLALLQGWITQGRLRDRRLILVTRGVQAVTAGAPVRPWQAAAIGLAKVAGLELPRLAAITVDLPVDLSAAEWPADAAAILAEPGEPGGRAEIALRAGRRWVQEVRPTSLPAAGFNPFRPWGVHVIAGGARGIGLAVACHMARRSRARLLLLGRSPAESAAAALAAIAAAGGEAIYRQADLTDPPALAAALDEARTLWGPINGVIHSALVLADRSLLRLDEDSLRAALDPKTRGLVALATATASDALDYVAVFSSANAVFGNAGQANYVAGCRFTDAFAACLRGRGVKAVTINWGYWGEVGVVSDPALRARLERQGILPITVEDGLAAFEAALCAGVDQIMPVAGTADAFAQLGVQAGPARMAPSDPPPAPDREEAEEAGLARLERLAARETAAALADLGFVPGPARHPDAWIAACGVAPAWHRLFLACLDLLARHGLAIREGDGYAARPLPSAEAGAGARIIAENPGLAAHATLLERAVAALPGVLQGRADGLSALMPGGSLDLLEAVYVAAAATDRLNRAVAEAVAEFVRAAPADRPLRVLEVGGGTGGTTRAVVPVLAALRPEAGYLFTDVSPAFLPLARQRFGGALAGFETQRLDIAGEPDPALPPADLILAVNVLHATPDLRQSLVACRRLLRPGGRLVLTETTALRDFATLTFGLTPGWWNARDGGRLPHSPAASAERWLALLEAAGFAAPRRGPAAGKAGQTLFVADRPPALLSPGARPDAGPPPPAGARPALRTHLAGLVGAVLKLRPEAIDPAEPFGTYGLESVMALEVIAALEPVAGPLPKTLLFEADSVEGLAAWLETHRPEPARRLGAPARAAAFRPDRSGADRVSAALPAEAAAPAVSAPALSAPLPSALPADAIAVVAVAGRYPGARTPDDLWALLRDGRSAITEVPPGRWDHAAHYDPDGTRDGKAGTRFGGFIDDVACFDAPLFRISPAEARATDPMERHFLEVVWEVLEAAGHTPERLKRGAENPLGGDVGVFVGVMSQTYEQLATEIWAKGRYTGAFSSHSSIANRASFLFDFTGPSVALDTACSSSLSAIHMACEAIRRGDCRAAIAGGANLLLHPLHHILMSAYRVLSPDALTRAFGAGGKGFVVGEGVGAVLLRPLADAQRDGDPVLAVVRGSAVNTCGRTSSYSAPSVTAQAAVIRAALRRAGLDPASLSYVEAHGTGTELGDPVEVRALALAFAAETDGTAAGAASEASTTASSDASSTASSTASCALGSIKPNIGHLEAAAGIAGLTKVLLQLRHGALAPSLHAEPANPEIDFAGTPFRVQTALAPWPRRDGPRRAGISSFGLGGANAHLILEEAPAAAPAIPDDGTPALILVSGRTEERLRAQLARLAAALRAAPDLTLRDVAWTLQVGRQALAERWALVVRDRAALLLALDDHLAGRPVPGLQRGSVSRPGGAGAAPDPAAAADPHRMAVHWAAGGHLVPERLPRNAAPRIVALPTYAFERRRYWLDEGPGFSKEAVAASRAEDRAASAAASREAACAAPAPDRLDPVADYYDATLPVRADRLEESYFSLAPLTDPPPGFSWTRTVLDPQADPACAEALLAGQRDLRRVLLAGLALGRPGTRMLDFGCGAGTDLIRLAQTHPGLQGWGRTLSPEHARVAAARTRLAGLDARIVVETGDSAASPFPGPFDLILGIEVLHHIRDKDRLLANLAAALAPDGTLALADCVAPRVGIAVPETGSWTLAEPAYAAAFARAGLALVRVVDGSREIARCLDDAEVGTVMARLAADGLAPDRLALVARVHAGWSNFGRALAEGGIRYLLLQARPSPLETATLTARNRAALAAAQPYAAALRDADAPARPSPPVAESAVAAVGATQTEAVVRETLAHTLGMAPDEIAAETPFAEQGLDSLGGLRFLDALNRALGLELGTATLYDHPSLADLEAHLAGLAPRGPGAAAPAVPDAPSTVPAPAIPAPHAAGAAGPVAIVGLATRLPGAADQAGLWTVLREERDCVTEIPPDRWDIDRHWSPDPERRDRSYGKWGGFLTDVDAFDAAFFGIAAREAACTDPQQRIFLETAWHALEDAGLAGPALKGARCGIYAGLCGDEYRGLMREAGVEPDAYLMLGNAGSILAARLSYLLDLKGPALALDTACSSSLVAVHLAVQAIRRGEVDLALAGGVSLYLGEWPFKQLSRAGMLSPTGRCRSFDADADGIVPAEGAVALVLKPLDRALADRDQIYGVILGSGVNQDGRTNGMTAPSAAAQAALIGAVLDEAGIPAESIGLIEAHGTGTRLGDPIEAAGLVAAFSARTDRREFCALGTLKSNLGHTTAASGAAGLAKALLAMRHATIPATLHLRAANPLMSLDGSAFRLARHTTAWAPGPWPRRAGVSSFGFSGTNAHVVVEEAPRRRDAVAEPGWRLVALSARDAAGLRRRIADLAAWLDPASRPDAEPVRLADLAYTCTHRRRHEAVRAAFVVEDLAGLRAALAAASAGLPAAGLRVAGPAPAPGRPPSGAARTGRAWHDWLQAQASAYRAGGDLDLSALDEGDAVRVTTLPGYPFARDRHWFETPAAPEPMPAGPTLRFQAPVWAEVAGTPLASLAPGLTVALVNDPSEAESLATILPGPIDAVVAAQTEDIAAALSRHAARPVRIVHLWPLDPARPQDPVAEAAELLTLVQALGRLGGQGDTRLLHLHPLGRASGAGGLVASLPQMPTPLSLSTLALDGPLALDAVATILASPAGEFRLSGGVLRQRLWRPISGTAPRPEPGGRRERRGTILLAGGFGGIGRALCRHLARPGVNLAILGRSALDEAGECRLAALRETGAGAGYWRADVTDRGSLERSLSEIRACFGPVVEVHHLAGAIGQQPLADKTAAEIAAVLAGKVAGVVALDAALAGHPVERFVLHGSLAASLGDFGQGDYAVANRFLEDFAEAGAGGLRRCIAWPLWAEGGMRPGDAAAALVQGLTGQPALTTGDGLAALDAALGLAPPVVRVMTGAGTPAAARPVPAAPVPPSAGDPVLDWLRRLAAGLLREAPAAIDPAASLLEYGFDSITLKELAAALSRALGAPVGATLFYRHGSLAEVADHLRATHPGPLAALCPAGSVTPDPAPHEPPAAAPGDGVAILGMAGRFPGAPDLEALWPLLRDGGDAIRPPPPGRPGWDGVGTPAGYLDRVEDFDADFFQIAPAEAALMDPQQRLFLQAAWHALEAAALAPTRLAGSRTGVFVGVQGSDYADIVGSHAAPQLIGGLAHAGIANRVSYWLDLRGPSTAIDAACAGGLIAVHRAARAILSGECDLALAGGVSLLLSPRSSALVDAMGVLAPDGRCKSFSRHADGYGRGEGVAVVVLKALARALADGDPILGVIRGSGEGHGGHAASLTAPNPAAQAALLRQVWDEAGIAAGEIAYVEAHGTGTELGDPIEAEGLREALAGHAAGRGEAPPAAGQVGLGSVKSNLGHLEPASGLAGLAKLLLAFRHGTLPATLHAAEPNPLLRLEDGPLRLVSRPEPWAGGVAGLSAFGFTGAMAHLVLAPPPARPAAIASPAPDAAGPLALPLSARDRPALRRMAAALCALMEGPSPPSLPAVARTLRHGRAALEHRVAVVAREPAEAAALLRRWLDGGSGAGVFAPAGDAPRRPFRQILATSPVPAPEEAAAQARAFAEGATLAWPKPAGLPAPLPLYPFATAPHWATAVVREASGKPGERSSEERSSGETGTGEVLPLDPRALAGLEDHVVAGRATVPASATAALLRATTGIAAAYLSDLLWSHPLPLEPPGRLRLSPPDADGTAGFEILASDGLVAVSGLLRADPPPASAAEPVARIAERCPERIDGPSLYAAFAAAGLACGPAFQRLAALHLGADEALGRLAPARVAMPEPDPSVLDAAAQAGSALLRRAGAEPLQPFAADGVRVFGRLTDAAFVRARQTGPAMLDLSVLDGEGRVLAAVDGFFARPAGAASPPSVWVPDWAPAPAVPAAPETGPVLVLRHAADRGLTEALRRIHPALTEIRLGAESRRCAPGVWETAPAALDAALAEAEAEAGSFARIYALNTLSGQDAVVPEALPARQELGLTSLFRLVRWLSRPGRGPATLVAVTDGVEAETPDPTGGGIAGFCLSLGPDWPAGRVAVVDIASPSDDCAALARALAAETAAPGHPVAHVLRDGERLSRRLRPVALPPGGDFAPGTYLLIGGAGGLGAAVARHLAGPGMRLVLTGRRPADGRIAALLAGLTAAGAAAEYVAVDAAEAPAMLALVARLQGDGRIAGVVHAALVLANAPLARMDEATFAAALTPKVAGSLWLDQAFATRPPGFLALFSSLIGVSGGAGQANYAAAASFQDAYGRWLATRLDCPVRILDWGYWSEAGIVAQPAERARLARRGMGGLTTPEGLALFARALAGSETRLVIARTLPPAEPVPAIPVQAATLSPARDVPSPTRPPQDQAATPSRARVLGWLRGIVGEVLGRPGEALPETEPLVLLGIDSLVNMQVLRRLETALGRLPRTLLFEHGHLGALADALREAHAPALGQVFGHVVEQDTSHQETGSEASGPQDPIATGPAPNRPGIGSEAVAEPQAGIAIIGLACRFPGAPNPEAFWRMIREGRDAFGPVPADRWSADPAERGAFLDRVDLFDPLHFGISFREAAAMDPQERLFLETAWHALEDAGHSRASLRAAARTAGGADVGVYVGVMNGAFQLHAVEPGVGGRSVQAIAPYWSIANRVSWLFDFHGPSLAVDTACSASAAALHLACEAMCRGEIGAALVGGVSLLLHPRQFETLRAMRMVSPSGRCRPFAEGADGFLPGEGVGAVVLRPLAQALAGGDRILGVIRGSAMNTGGRTSGYTVPSPVAQAEVVAAALAAAGVAPETIGYVEAHGTGTALGDPIEAEALGRALGEGPRVALGSVKALIGHLESAAGMAGLARVLLQFRHGEIAPAPLCGAPNPALPQTGRPLALPGAPQPWTGPRRAGLSSFGAGGVNVHLVLEPPPPAVPAAPAAPSWRVVPLSARTGAQLRAVVEQLATFVAEEEPDLAALAYTLQTGWEAMPHRVACLAADRPGLLAALRDILARPDLGAAPVGEAPPVPDVSALAPADLARLWQQGADLPWASLWDGPVPRRIGLPPTPFARERHWPAGLVPGGRAAPRDDGLHPLIARVLPSLGSARFALRLDAGAPLLAGHRVDGQPLLPGAAVFELVRAAAGMASGRPVTTVADMAWLAPLPAGTEAVLTLTEGPGGLRFELTSESGGARRLHASGLVPPSGGEALPAQDLAGLAAGLTRSLEGEAIYARLARLGVAYAGEFRALARIAFDADNALATLRPPEPEPGLPWHPALLDAALQSTMGVLEAAGRIEPLVPFMAERLHVTAPLDAARAVWVRRLPGTGAGGVTVSVSLLDPGGVVLAQIDRVTLRRRPTGADVAPPLTETSPAADPPVPAAPAAPEAPLDALDRLAAQRVLANWQQRGLFATAGQRLGRDDLVRALSLDPRHGRLLDAALDLFTQRGWLAREGAAWTALPACAATAGWPAAQHALAAAEPALAPHLELLDRCVAALGGILDGSVPATDAFFPGGSMELLGRVYAGDAHAAFLHEAVAGAVAAAVRRAGPGARVLEIGAGTGSTTAPVLRALRDGVPAARYLFTDLSPRFLHQARAGFGAGDPGFRTAVLDIARDPADQLPGEAGFDVVLAANVLHATPCMAETLRHAAALLAPGGTLVVNEMTAARDFATLTFGLLDGWWLSRDPERRLPHAPLLGVAQWRDLLAEAGLTLSAITLPPGLAAEAEAPQAVLVARKPVAAPPPRDAAAPFPSDPRRIEQVVTEAVATVFEMPVEAVHQGGLLSFSELGGDSLLSAELAAEIGRRLGVPLKTTAIFNHPTIPALAEHIAEEFPARAVPEPGRASSGDSLAERAAPAPVISGPITSQPASPILPEPAPFRPSGTGPVGLERGSAPRSPAASGPVPPETGAGHLDPVRRALESASTIERVVTEAVATVFEMPVEAVRQGGLLSFSELGGDSLLSAELAAEIGRRLGVPLKTTAIFNHPTIPALAEHIAEDFPAGAFPDLPGVRSGSAEDDLRPAAPAAPDPLPADDPLDAVLNALEAGRIDVDEALRRLSAAPFPVISDVTA
ncbi:hypothetical protein VP06_28590 [Methylobacterium aquaticum]|uniref:Polyketide synthase n=1 Tax=Methylobacterium aquaticum TaxID=270351 RepID=A0A0J6RZ62_9HYPH|nr:hypothetical protein VP06_28590 [Methylobacterium aquaticum]